MGLMYRIPMAIFDYELESSLLIVLDRKLKRDWLMRLYHIRLPGVAPGGRPAQLRAVSPETTAKLAV